MAENSKIEWCDHTFNPWEGCTKVGPGCDHCYAEVRNARFGGGESPNWGPGAPRRRTSAANWRKPIKWNDTPFYECQKCGWRGPENRMHPMVHCCTCGGPIKETRPRVFCASLADVFDNEVDPQWRADLFWLITNTPNLDWLILTKRIGNVFGMVPLPWSSKDVQHGPDPKNIFPGGWPSNVWLGATIVNQEEADRDIPKLLKIPAKVRFLSMEPLLGAVDLTYTDNSDGMLVQKMYGIDWVIVGGESGGGARAVDPNWVRSLRNQCRDYHVPFLFKQWGEWAPYDRGKTDGALLATPYSCDLPLGKFGKKMSGRELDGKTHTEFPEAIA